MENKINAFKPPLIKNDEKNNNNNNNTNKKNEKVPNSFKDKLNMFANRGPMKFGGPRPSVQLASMPNFDNLIKNNNNKQNLDIIKENVDKEKEGYNPANELEKKLDNIVVKKDKKKKKKINFEE